MINFIENELLQSIDNKEAVLAYESLIGLSGPLISNVEFDSEMSLIG